MARNLRDRKKSHNEDATLKGGATGGICGGRLQEEALRGFAAPSYAEGGFQDVGGNFCEVDAGGAFFAPAPWDWREDFGSVLDHAGLLIAGEQEDPVALMFECEGGEDFAGDAEVGVAEVGAFGGFGQRECDAAEGCWFHVRLA
jgi:hypothetical protein